MLVGVGRYSKSLLAKARVTLGLGTQQIYPERVAESIIFKDMNWQAALPFACSCQSVTRGLAPLSVGHFRQFHGAAYPAATNMLQASQRKRERLRHSASRRVQTAQSTLEGVSMAETTASTEEAQIPIEIPPYCSGCGVKLQSEDKDSPGFYQLPKRLLEPRSVLEMEDDEELDPEFEREPEAHAVSEPEGAPRAAEPQDGKRIDPKAEQALAQLDRMFDDWDEDEEGGEEGDESPPVIEEDEAPRILCARCYSLTNYGRVKSPQAEAALPEFDLGRKVGRKIALQKFRRPVVLCVVDIVDFDGSIPRNALQELLPASMSTRQRSRGNEFREEERARGWNQDRVSGMEDCRLVLAVNKADLLPAAATQQRIETWVRKRAAQAGLTRPDSVHLVSSTKAEGIGRLLGDLKRISGLRGDVWVVGAQNAGKSSLINAMRRAVGRSSKNHDVTTAALPGTTLGMLRIDGIMPGRCRMFDTPGVPHTHQLSSQLTPDEVRLLLPRGRLTPRTFRAAAGQTVFVGGVARVDVVTCPGSTLYLTVWASSDIPCHYGKTEGAEDRYTRMVGSTLVPPIGDAERLKRLGPLIPVDVEVEGASWQRSSMDVAIAGLGWIGVGLSGVAQLRVWTHDSVAVTVRDALVPDSAKALERPGLGNQTRKPSKVVKQKRK